MASEMSETVSACVGAEGNALGMPQLCSDWMGNQVFWLVVTLVVIFFILSRLALPRIASILAERHGTITSDLAAAEDLKDKARAAEEAYEKALAAARTAAQKIIAETKAEIQAELDEASEKAEAEIAARTAEGEKAIAEIRAGAIDSVREVARATAAELVAAMGAKPDAEALAAAIDARVKG